MKFNLLHLPYYLGLSILMIGTLFTVQHWPGGFYITAMGALGELIFLILLLVEILTSRKAKMPLKLLLSIAFIVLFGFGYYYLFWFHARSLFLFLVLATGIAYLRVIRRFVIVHLKEYEKIQFDSI